MISLAGRQWSGVVAKSLCAIYSGGRGKCFMCMFLRMHAERPGSIFLRSTQQTKIGGAYRSRKLDALLRLLDEAKGEASV
jgi:hypothetical protein